MEHNQAMTPCKEEILGADDVLEKVNNGDSAGHRRSTASCLYDRESKTVDGNYGCSYMMEKQGFKQLLIKLYPRSQVENIFQCYVKIL